MLALTDFKAKMNNKQIVVVREGMMLVEGAVGVRSEC